MIFQKSQTKETNHIERFVWRLDCRLKYVCYQQQTREYFMIFAKFMVKYTYFWRSLWRALQLTSVGICSFPIFGLCPPQTQKGGMNKIIERFVWRLDCRLKYVCYLLVIKFVIFEYFWGKMHLFLWSLWRALQSTSDESHLLSFFFFVIHKKQKEWRCDIQRDLCDGWTVVWSMSATYY